MNTEIRTIMVATDFLQSSRLALDYAVMLAHRLGANLVIVNAFELGPEASSVEKVDRIPSRTRRDAEVRPRAFAKGVNRAGIPADGFLVEGVVPDAFIESVDKFKADLLVLGTQGVHRGLGHLLIGSNTEALMLRSHVLQSPLVRMYQVASILRDTSEKSSIYRTSSRRQ